MSAPTSAVAVCNLALDLLDVEQISSITANELTDAEVICARWYDQTRRECLEAHPWNFAKTIAQLSSSGTPAFGYSNQYGLPNDYLTLLFIGNTELDQYRIEYDIQGRDILIDTDGASSLNVGYIKDETLVPRFSALFIRYLAAKLAKNMAFKFTTKNSVLDRINREVEDSEAIARVKNGQQRPPRRRQRSRAISARTRLMSANVASRYTTFEG